MAQPPHKPTSDEFRKTLGEIFSGRMGQGGRRSTILTPNLAVHPTIVDRWFKDETLHIDGYTFQGCRFDRCKLVTESGTFNFENCYISPDCELFFDGTALKVVRLLMHHLQIIGKINLTETEKLVT